MLSKKTCRSDGRLDVAVLLSDQSYSFIIWGFGTDVGMFFRALKVLPENNNRIEFSSVTGGPVLVKAC
jgi:hypothetical protein